MSNTQVVTVCSHVPHEPYYRFDLFMASLQRYSEAVVVLGMGEHWQGLMTKPNRLRDWLRAGKNTSERIMVCDAFDIVFTQHPHGIGDRCAELFGDAVVFNAEKGLFPRGDLFESFPETGTAWRYLNSGFFCGPADRILALLNAMPMEQIGYDPPGGPYPNDQGEYQALWAQHVAGVNMALDSNCEVSQTFSACEPGEFEITAEGVRNIATGTWPGVAHFNGASKNDILPLVASAMGLG